jgi:hypothetical protein
MKLSSFDVGRFVVTPAFAFDVSVGGSVGWSTPSAFVVN